MSRISDRIKKYISCPQFGNEHYGEWGILTLEQRRLIKELVETCDMFEETADYFAKENKDLKHRLSNCIEPKFKVGQEVWHCFKNCNEPAKTVIESIDIEVNKEFIDFTYYDVDGFGFDEIMLFTTEEEAKAKLEKMKNG